jgi:hypothetical protein
VVYASRARLSFWCLGFPAASRLIALRGPWRPHKTLVTDRLAREGTGLIEAVQRGLLVVSNARYRGWSSRRPYIAPHEQCQKDTVHEVEGQLTRAKPRDERSVGVERSGSSVRGHISIQYLPRHVLDTRYR